MTLLRPIGRSAAAALCAISLAGLTSEARATAMFDASAEARLVLQGIFDAAGTSLGSVPTGLGIIGAQNVSAVRNAVGAAGASASATAGPGTTPTAIVIGGAIQGTATVSGAADVPGEAVAAAGVSGAINGFTSLALSNTTADAYTLEFVLTYSLSASAPVDNPVNEDAESEASVEIVSLFGSFDFLADLAADALGDDSPTAIVNAMETFSLALGPGDEEGYLLFVRADGSATAAPAPGTLLLGVVGLAFVARARRSMKRAT